jgi:ATP-dependent exoDNAse (exonuclease V) beta subunit
MNAEGATPWNAQLLAQRFELTNAQALEALTAARRVRAAPALQRFYGDRAQGGASAGSEAPEPAGARTPIWSDNEVELIDVDGAALRIDRLVEFEDGCWVLDYKWQLPPGALVDYRRQVQRYAQVLARAGMRKPVRLLLIASDASSVEVPLAT